MKGLTPLMSSKYDAWCTPSIVLDVVRLVGRIELDPCSNEHSLVGADRMFDRFTDGLWNKWSTEPANIAYVNPPYGRSINRWVARCALSSTSATVVALIPARTDTLYWHNWIKGQARAVCFWKGRLKFFINGVESEHGAPFPSALVLWTSQVGMIDRFVTACQPHGHVMR